MSPPYSGYDSDGGVEEPPSTILPPRQSSLDEDVSRLEFLHQHRVPLPGFGDESPSIGRDEVDLDDISSRSGETSCLEE